jgi:hypothetical protein
MKVGSSMDADSMTPLFVSISVYLRFRFYSGFPPQMGHSVVVAI